MIFNEWRNFKLEDTKVELIDGDRGKNYPKKNEFYEDGYCLFLNAKNITEDGFVLKQKMFINKEKDELLRKGKLNRNDIILTTRGTVGNVGLYDSSINYNNVRINSGMVIIRCNQESEYYKYIYWLFRSPLLQEQITLYSTGSAQPQLPIKIIKKLDLVIPPYSEQVAIANILSTLDEKIEVNNQINETLENMAQALFKQWFVDFDFPNENGEPYKSCGGEMVESELGLIPEGWTSSTLKDIIEITSGKRPNERQEVESDVFNIPLAGASSIMGYTKDFNFDSNILIIGRVGTHGVIQRFQNKVWASDNTLVISSDYYEFLYQILKSIDYKSLNRGSTQPLITQKDIKNHEIVIPEKSYLDKYEQLSEKLFSKVNSNNLENKTLREIRDTLLPKLMSGEIRVPLDSLEESVT